MYVSEWLANRKSKERDMRTIDEVPADYLEAIEEREERYKEALEKIACRHVTESPLWWQVEARNALAPQAEEARHDLPFHEETIGALNALSIRKP
jgi:hypothetical protein